MIFGKTKMELKVGIFVFIGLAILVIFIMFIGNFKTWDAGYNVSFVFNFINGIRVGAPVRFAGMDVGEVKKLRLMFSPEEGASRIKVYCRLKKDAKIPYDSKIWVNTLGLLGEKYIEIVPGKDYSKLLIEDESLAGEDPVPMYEVGQIAKRIATDVDDVILKIKNQEGTIGKLIGSDELYKDLDAFIKDIKNNPWKLFFKSKEKK